MNIGSIYLATRSSTPRPPIAIAGPVILDCTDVYSRPKTPMYILVQVGQMMVARSDAT